MFINKCNISITWSVITIGRILSLVMSFLNIVNIVKATLARGCEKQNKAFVNPDQLGRASWFLLHMHMIQLLIDRCIIFVSLELLLFKYNSNKNCSRSCKYGERPSAPGIGVIMEVWEWLWSNKHYFIL